MPDPDVEPPDSDPFVAQGHEHRPVELFGPSVEVERIVRRASPARLALRVGVVIVALLGGAAGAWAGRAWWAERRARAARMTHVPGAFDVDVTE